nr:MAG TPA: hypothetical protein [Caudoviricetes sp.]
MHHIAVFSLNIRNKSGGGNTPVKHLIKILR